jgi:D-beta-D-heptose 7-phosphate kinase / D-beta-D-heptose 1-phosphate adenosyltransferase
VVSQEDRAAVLRALRCVDEVVIFDEDTPEAVLERLRPDVWAKGGDYDAADLPEARVVARWGGRVEILPFLEGRSSTRLLQEAAARGV